MDGRYESRKNYVDVPPGTQVRFPSLLVEKKPYHMTQRPSKDIRWLFDASGIRSS